MNRSDEHYMRRALQLAARGEGYVEPNPMVGAVVVRDGRIVGQGWHKKFGGPHAEIHALDAAGDQAIGADLYVTLEPCCHHGKTPPCTDRIIRSGICRIVVAIGDPNPLVAGKGIALLRDAKIQVDCGVLSEEASYLIAPFRKLITTQRPYVISKWAMTADGKIATQGGESKWITSEDAREHSHRYRGRIDAILVGIGTVLADNPRLEAKKPARRTPVRIVLDSELKTPVDCHLVATARSTPTLIAFCRPNELKIDALQSAGCELLHLPADGGGHVSIDSLLTELGRRKLTSLLVEGGAQVHGAFLQANAIDSLRLYMAPRLFGGDNAPGPFAGVGAARIADSCTFKLRQTLVIGDDLFVEYRKGVSAD